MSQDIQQFVEYLEKSQLLKSANMAATDFAELLVEKGILTRWQANKLMDKKFKGFHLDEYLLLDHHHYDDERAYYVAKNLNNQQTVLLGVQPLSQNPPGDERIYYDVLPFE